MKPWLKSILFHYLSHFRKNLIDFLYLFHDNRLTVFLFFNIKGLHFLSKTVTIKSDKIFGGMNGMDN
ncbi:hypothetical protein SPAR71_1745 [Streptococcus pneumoniae GA41437]|nr:hypothetical protein SPAR71_1745 [Streptococcus pneumoniae GA41437]